MSLYADMPEQFQLGKIENKRVPLSEQSRQRDETEEILHRLSQQPGVVLADEVGMGKTFVALAVSYCVGVQNRKGPVVVMVPPNLIEKWEQDLSAFCSLYLRGIQPVARHAPDDRPRNRREILKYGVARHSVDFLRLLDDSPKERCHIIFLAQGAMSRSQTDIWVRLALIRETLKRHGRRERLQKVKGQIHRFLAELLYAKGQQRASDCGEEIWSLLLQKNCDQWMDLFNSRVKNNRHFLQDNPVPAAVVKALSKVDLEEIATALAEMPLRARGSDERISERIDMARDALRGAERNLWKEIIAKMRWRSPLLVLDEAHHLKNPGTALARQLQSLESDEDFKLGDGAMAESFDRMLFLTATPFQLGHQELVRILQRFGDVRWDAKLFDSKDSFGLKLDTLLDALTASQRAAIRIQKAWSHISEEDLKKCSSIDDWWESLQNQPLETLSLRHRVLVDAFHQAKNKKKAAEDLLRPWIVRHNKGDVWQGTTIARRQRLDGAAIVDGGSSGGLPIPGDQLLPFYLAARSAVDGGKNLLGEALCSSYEAFRQTREDNSATKDDSDEATTFVGSTPSNWFLGEFDRAIRDCSGSIHPKIYATVQRTVDLWESGEKVLVFAFYRHTCRALRIHISNEVEKRIKTHARRRLAGAGLANDDKEIERIIDSIHNRFFDSVKAPGRQSLDQVLHVIIAPFEPELMKANVPVDSVVDVMRRFLRVPTTLVRAFPIHQHDSDELIIVIEQMLDARDASGVSWRDKFERFLDFLLTQCSKEERDHYLDAVQRMQTGKIRVQSGQAGEDDDSEDDSTLTLANVQVATGKTERSQRARLMRSFNTPFFPDIFVCSQVMGEGVDLHRYCRHIIHHDLDWNPSSIEQRTGRVDRLGCKAEQQQVPISVYLPYLSGAADERQFRVMVDRENWFRIVMGQDEVAKLIPENTELGHPRPPESLQQALIFNLRPGSAADR